MIAFRYGLAKTAYLSTQVAAPCSGKHPLLTLTRQNSLRPIMLRARTHFVIVGSLVFRYVFGEAAGQVMRQLDIVAITEMFSVNIHGRRASV